MSINFNKNNISSKVDLTFIGSGISTSYTLLPLLKELNTKIKKPLSIVIIEENEELFTGLAYGNRSGYTALLITSLADFLPVGNERKEFIKWLSINKDELLEEFSKHGGDLSRKNNK